MKDLNGAFRLRADPSALFYWQVTPQRNLLELRSTDSGATSPGLVRQLEPRLMKLLCLLADANGDVMTRDELMTALWPRVVVNENSLTRAVSELRKALNPEPLAPAPDASGMIETVPKRGYRLNTQRLDPDSISDSSASVSEPDIVPVTLVSPTHLPQRHPQTYLMLVLAMVMSAAASSFWTQQAGSLSSAMPAAVAVAQPGVIIERSANPGEPYLSGTSAPGDHVVNESIVLPEGLQWRESMHMDEDLPELTAESNAVIAPDGRFVAFVEKFPGQSQLRLRSLTDSDEAWTVFTSHAPITHLQWSPLDAGLLFTVEDAVLATPAVLGGNTSPTIDNSARLARLMLLDLESMQIRELYRRAIPSESPSEKDLYTSASGNLT